MNLYGGWLTFEAWLVWLFISSLWGGEITNGIDGKCDLCPNVIYSVTYVIIYPVGLPGSYLSLSVDVHHSSQNCWLLQTHSGIWDLQIDFKMCWKVDFYCEELIAFKMFSLIFSPSLWKFQGYAPVNNKQLVSQRTSISIHVDPLWACFIGTEQQTFCFYTSEKKRLLQK